MPSYGATSRAGSRTTYLPPVGHGFRPAITSSPQCRRRIGSVGPAGVLRPEDPAKRLAALEYLRPSGHPFVLHLYAEYSGSGGWTAEQQVGEQIEQYAAAGFQTELVLTYRPHGQGAGANVAGFAGFVGDTVRAFASTPGFVSLQVTNEANVAGAPAASDGDYVGVQDALIQGVIAAKAAARSSGMQRLAVGFNWADADGPAETRFWADLGEHGGQAFLRALDWVGLDSYPGTWGPTLRATGLADRTRLALTSAFARLRNDYLPLAGIPGSVALHVSENGFPTGPGRTDAMQMTAMKAAIATIDDDRGKYNITDYRWFDLRDANSAEESFESRYGLMRDDYEPKPAFEVYRALVARLSAPHQSTQ